MKENTCSALVAVCLLFSSVQVSRAQGMKDKIGLGFNVGAQKIFCDIYHTGYGPGVEGFLKFLLSQHFNLTVSLGYGELNDGFVKNTFRTNLITSDLKGYIALAKPSRFIPYLSLGVGVHNYQYQDTDRYFDGSFIFGGGFEILLQPRTSLEAYADYRHTTGDALDGIVRQEKDGYMQLRIGLTYYFKDRLAPAKEEELIAMGEEDLADLLFEEEPADTGRFAAFEEKLSQMESEDSEFTLEEYLALKSKIDELNLTIVEKEKEIEELRTELDFKRDRIAELEGELQKRSVPTYTMTTPSLGFASVYEEGLRNFYSRQYQAAIETFQMLLMDNPYHRLSSNCQYWIGECYFGKGDYYNATEAFNKVFDYDFSYKKDDATLMLGRCYIKLGDTAKARLMLETLLRDYPDSEYVGKAEQHLRRLRG